MRKNCLFSRSPKSEKKKADKSSSIYAVVKKQSPKHNIRPQMSFEPPPPIETDNPLPPTVPTRPAQLAQSNAEEITSAYTITDQVISINLYPRGFNLMPSII